MKLSSILAAGLAVASPVGAALLSEYTFDYIDGISDSTGNRDLGFVGSLPIIEGGVYQSDGSSSNYLEWTGGGGLPDFTVSLWVKTPQANQGNFKGIFASDNSSAASFSWQVDSHSGQYRLVSNSGINLSLGTPTADAWEHIAIQKYGGGNVRSYFNGVLVDDRNTNPGGIFRQRFGINRNSDASFTGQIGLAQIYNDSTTDVAALFAAGPGIVPEPGRSALLLVGALGLALRRHRGRR